MAVPRQIVFLACLAFVLKIVFALSSYGSIDVLLFEAHLKKITQDGGLALYRDGIRTEWCGNAGQRVCLPFNHPPFMIHALKGWSALSRLSGLPVWFWIRFTCAVADVGSLALVGSMLSRGQRNSQSRLALLLFAASPIAILVSGFHGNTDPIMVFLVLLSVWAVQNGRAAWLAGAALGAAASIKIVPFLLGPALLLSQAGARRRLAFAASVGAVFLAGSWPFVATDPALVAVRVFGYSPPSGVWGLPLLALLLQSGSSTTLYEAYARYGRVVTLSLVAAASVRPKASLNENAVLLRTGFLLALTVFSAPGFGVQYLAWLTPFVVVLGVAPTAIYYVSAMVFLVAYYTAAAGELGHLATTLQRPAWNSTMIGLGLMCWLVVCWICSIYVRKHMTPQFRSGGGGM